ncbi:MAG TPA: 23S rRNA (pseudouridine(1915)-N(3))-methyltransferase RlmH [Bacteroidia bacterium]
MKVNLLVIAKTEEAWLREGIAVYLKRLERYLDVKLEELPALKNAKNMSEEQQKQKEGESIMAQLEPADKVILLDERGKEYDSKALASFMQQQMNQSVKRLVFVVGGPYGFSEELKLRANGKLSLSKMTFSHQMVRLFFTEQLYRAMTILKGEPYHHS